MKTFLKIAITIILFVYLGSLSLGKIVKDVDHYRLLATPESSEKQIDYGPPVTAVFVKNDSPWIPNSGIERDEDILMEEMENLLIARRITSSDAFTAYSFIPTRCMKCHEKDGPGTFFYDNKGFEEDQLFATKDGLVLRSWPLQGLAPTLKYDFFVRHAKKIPFEVGGNGEQILKLSQ